MLRKARAIIVLASKRKPIARATWICMKRKLPHLPLPSVPNRAFFLFSRRARRIFFGRFHRAATIRGRACARASRQ